jgi:phospholipid/cholesterol/gamma-HCH transport system substrate-binding protein
MSRQSVFKSVWPVAAASVVALAIALYWLDTSGSLGPLSGATYGVKMTVPTAAGLAPGTAVRMAGVRIGRVGSIQRIDAGARIALKIDDKYAPLPTGSTAALRLRTLVGENYVSVDRGRGIGHIPDNGIVPMQRGREYVEVDQILSQLRGKTRERAQKMFVGLGVGLHGQGRRLNDVLDDASGFVQSASPVVDELNRDRRQVARLVDNLGNVTRAVGERGASLRHAARDAQTTFQTIAASDSSIRSALAVLPATMRQARTTSDTLRRVSDTATPTITSLASTVRALGPSVAALRPAAQTARSLVRELGAAAPPLTTTVKRLRQVSGPASSALPAIGKIFCQTNPALDYLRPYAEDIPRVLQDLGSTTNYYDANGHAARLFATFGSNDLAALTPTTAKMVDTLLRAGAIGKHTSAHGYDPLPAPGKLDDLTRGRGIAGPSDVKEKYPRIKAAC